jgi:hypothetical protein
LRWLSKPHSFNLKACISVQAFLSSANTIFTKLSSSRHELQWQIVAILITPDENSVKITTKVIAAKGESQILLIAARLVQRQHGQISSGVKERIKHGSTAAGGGCLLPRQWFVS